MDYLYVAPKFTTTKFYTGNSHSWENIKRVSSHYTHIMHNVQERPDIKGKYYYR